VNHVANTNDMLGVFCTLVELKPVGYNLTHVIGAKACGKDSSYYV